MESLYRKYRPQTFADVVGQQHIVSTLERAVTENRVSHAYLFCGPRGTGKTTMARILAKALLCEHGPGALPDGTCEECQLIAAGEHPDVYELDAASRTGVDNVREEIIGSVDYAPVRGQYKVYIIDEVHMLTPQAFNALLKTLEEPPSHVVFIMCTTDPQRILATILSRVQRFDFHAISNDEMHTHLADICAKEGFTFEDEALDIVVRHARGGMRDAISTLEQLSVFGSGSIKASDARNLLGETSSTGMQKTTAALAQRNVATLFNEVSELCNAGRDPLQFTRELAAHIRDLYVVSVAGTKTGVVDANEQELDALSQEAAAFGGPDRLANILTVLGDAASQMRTATNQRLVLEIALTKATRPEGTLTLESLAERLEALEKNGVSAQPVAQPAMSAASAAQPAAAAIPQPAAPIEPAAQAKPAPSIPVPQPKPAPVPQPQPKPAPAPKPVAPVAQPKPAPSTPVPQPRPQPAPAPQPKPAPAPQAQAAPTKATTPQQDSAPVHAAVVRMPSAEESAPRSGGDLQRTWKKVVDNLVAASGPYGTLLLNTYAQSDDGNALYIVIEGSDFALRMLERPDIKLSVNDAVARLFGRRTVCYVKGEIPKDSTPEQQGAPSQAPAPAPVATKPEPPVAAPAPQAPAPQQQATPVAQPVSTPAPQPTPAPKPATAPAPQPVPTPTPQPVPAQETTPRTIPDISDDDDEFDPSIYDDVDSGGYYDGYDDVPYNDLYGEPAQMNTPEPEPEPAPSPAAPSVAPTQTDSAVIPEGLEESASLISGVFEGAKPLPDTPHTDSQNNG